MPLRRAPGIVLVLMILACLGLPLTSTTAEANGELLTRDGLTELLDQAPGRVVVVNYWASWCGPCLTEMPTLKAMRAEYAPEELTLLGVSFDFDPKAYRRMLERLDLNFPSHLAKPDLMQTLGVTSVPRTDFHDGRGRLVRSHEGLLTAEEFRAIVAEVAAADLASSPK